MVGQIELWHLGVLRCNVLLQEVNQVELLLESVGIYQPWLVAQVGLSESSD